MYQYFFKRIIDIIMSFLLIIILSPLMIITGIIISLTSKGGPLFIQKRIGKHEKEFNVLKFRSMKQRNSDIEYVDSFEDNPRITKIGKIIRKTSIDELPQLFNIFIGHMSFIGPRPILRKEFEDFKDNSFYLKRFSKRPGLFCTVDIKYRATADRKLQFSMDAEYCQNVRLFKDIKIFFKVFIVVITGKNVYK